MDEPIPKLDGLCKVRPKRLSRVIRLVWPDIKAARKFGHTLKFIHERLVESGLPISYNQLTVYVSRIRREESAAARADKQELPPEKLERGPATVEPKAPSPVESDSSSKDPLENYRGTCIRKQPGLLGGTPDESKLI